MRPRSRAETLGRNVDVGSVREVGACADYALIAAMRGWMPMMFIARVRL